MIIFLVAILVLIIIYYSSLSTDNALYFISDARLVNEVMEKKSAVLSESSIPSDVKQLLSGADTVTDVLSVLRTSKFVINISWNIFILIIIFCVWNVSTEWIFSLL